MQNSKQMIVVGLTACLIGVLGTLAIVIGTGLTITSDSKSISSTIDVQRFYISLNSRQNRKVLVS